MKRNDYEYDHARYLANREARIEAQRIYRRDYQKKGLRKPRKPRDDESRRAKQREYYWKHRDEILEKQRAYYAANRDRIQNRRTEHGFDKYAMK